MSNLIFEYGGILMMVFGFFFIPASIILTLMGIYNIMKNPANDSTLRLTWVIILIFIPFFGFLFYLIIGIKQLRVN